ncbi:MFS transporter [Campylobacter sp. MIT 21-1685]|uniref:MFS transporter n=1 Tax=unclassified Campylobacter TaxID=2593542 RepID=UPI00224B49F2|nr:MULTISPECIES: MFS transporter [unclassified Campylobacter]MCX2682867.1 MFS transporter [Campylobacter sp. MIT 21-1684]MCX2751185.1 MFS transporter [Campylobacter sp. MIT 21-1682]MCX2807348.1 MFS transporter [Campylobacter sp. MIT 21-1685]
MSIANSHITKSQRVRSIFAASSGNFVEWFDFYIYLSLASYFTHHFFNSENEVIALIQSFGVFAIGFFMRPIGSLIFGSLADKVGRQKTMIYAIVLMSLGNFMIAFIPSQEKIGLWAAFLLTLARMIQGVSVGGEGGLVATYISEMSTKGNRGFFSSFQYVTLIAAQFVALGCVWLAVSYFGVEKMREDAWRYLFILAGILALGSLFLRATMHESARELDKKDSSKGSLKTLWHYRKYCLLVFGLTAAGSMCYYNFTAYMKTFLDKSALFDKDTAYIIALLGLAFGMIIQPFMGMIGDKIGVRKMLVLFSVLGFFGVFPLMMGIIESGPKGSLNSPYLAFLFIALGLIISGFYTSIAGIAKATLFPEKIRALGTGFPYAIAVACFGGTVPSVALWFKAGGPYGSDQFVGLAEWGYFIYIMFFLACCFLVAINIPKETELEKQNDSIL